MDSANPINEAQEIKRMVVGYAKQETLEPLKALGKYLGLGAAGAILVFLGMFFISVGVLRLVQSFEIFEGGSWASTVPYLAAIGVLLVVLAILGMSLAKAKDEVR